MQLNESTHRRISDLIAAEQVVLFMKGTRSSPQCGFSAQVVRILDELLPRYAAVDVLGAPEIREGIKVFSDWPTIPQLYVGGNFIGGCDIVRELYASGELHRLLGLQTNAINEPISERGEGDVVAPTVKGVIQLEPAQLKAMLDAEEIALFDVRSGSERAIAKIAGARWLDETGQEYLFSLDPKTPVAIHCHHGVRSQQVAEQLRDEGFRLVYNLRGGIDAWSRLIDPTVPRY